MQAGLECVKKSIKLIGIITTSAFNADRIQFINFENGNAIFEVASFKSAYKLNVSKRYSNETIDKNQKCNQ